jgi:ubiquinone/menaquinone biosynthesis C-methylase UbiE
MYHRYVGTRPVDSLDITLDEDMPFGDLPFDRVRTSYDVVAANYANELADEILAKPIERGMLLAFADLVKGGVVGDVGCGPGHIAKHLATTYGVTTIGFDISHAMIEQAHAKFPAGEFHVGSIFDLPVGNAAWRGAVARYTLLHSTPDERVRAFRELARVIAPDGYLLYCFYVSAPDHPEGSIYHLTSWFGHAVDLDVHFIGVEDAADEIDQCGFTVEAVLLREPMQKNELPTRRCYMLAHRR